jgi:sulfur-oxidizing protein SoxX
MGWLRELAILAGLGIAACSTMSSDAMNEPLAAPGDAARGRAIFISREGGHCVLCHSVPGVAVSGNVGPSLASVGSRLSAAQIRLRIADITRVNPGATMPVFHGSAGLRVAPQYAGKTPLDGQQVEDLVAWLSTLK